MSLVCEERVNRLRKNVLVVLGLLCAVSMLAGLLGGCGPNGPGAVSPSHSDVEPMTLHIYLFNGEPEGLDRILEEFYSRTRDTLNITLDFHFLPSVDYKQMLQMQLSASADMDLVFDAGWMTNNTLVSQGRYHDLEEYFNHDNYPGLKKAFPEDVLNANKMYGHLYWIPMWGAYEDMKGVAIRKDIREALGIDPIMSDEQLWDYLEAVQRERPDLTPLELGRKGFYNWFDSNQYAKNKAGIYEPQGTGNMQLYWDVAISADGKTVLGATTYGDSDEAFASYPEGFQYDFYTERFEQMQRWNRFLSPDSIASAMNGGVGVDPSGNAATLTTLSGMSELRNAADRGGYEVEFYPLYKEQRELVPGAKYTDYKANNFVAIPATVPIERVERIMQFLDWLYASQENNDLFLFGIEGVDWENPGDQTFTRLSDYQWPGYELGLNLMYARSPDNLTEMEQKYGDYAMDEMYSRSLLTGFVYDPSGVKSELAAINDIYAEIWFPLFHGTLEDLEGTLTEYHSRAEAAGLEKVRSNLIEQVQEFLDEQNHD